MFSDLFYGAIPKYVPTILKHLNQLTTIKII